MDRIAQYNKLNKLRAKEFMPKQPIDSTHPLKITFTLNETSLHYNPVSKLYSKKNIIGSGPASMLFIELDPILY